ECGVFKGFGLMTWANLSTMLEPENLTRRIYGFDTFAGLPSVTDKDANPVAAPSRGALYADSYDELLALIEEYDKDRFLGHIDKVHLIRVAVTDTIPRVFVVHARLMVWFLFFDLDFYYH